MANLRVGSQQEAQFIISQLHRQKLGHKRIVISYDQNNSPDPEQLKAMVVSVLQVIELATDWLNCGFTSVFSFRRHPINVCPYLNLWNC